jgi:hypothetical protein
MASWGQYCGPKMSQLFSLRFDNYPMLLVKLICPLGRKFGAPTRWLPLPLLANVWYRVKLNQLAVPLGLCLVATEITTTHGFGYTF